MNKSNPTEGEIVFDVDYPEMKASIMSSIYPKEVAMKFKGANTSSDFSTGMVSMVNVANYDRKEVVQLLKFLTDKKAAVYNQSIIDSTILSDAKYTIIKVNGEKEVAGYKCKKAILTIGNSEKFEVYYTQEINAKNCNWWSPFKEIDGMLMEYHVIKYGIHMHLKAREVKTEPIENDQFLLPKDYKKISVVEMDGIFNSLK